MIYVGLHGLISLLDRRLQVGPAVGVILEVRAAAARDVRILHVGHLQVFASLDLGVVLAPRHVHVLALVDAEVMDMEESHPQSSPLLYTIQIYN